MDNYYLNNAVYLTEEFLKSTKNPYYDGEVDTAIVPNTAGTVTTRGPTPYRACAIRRCTFPRASNASSKPRRQAPISPAGDTSCSMSLAAGTRFGPFEVTGQLGAGGPACARAVRELRRGLAEAQQRPRCIV